MTFSVTSKIPKFTETFTSELGLDKGCFDRIYRTFLLWLCQINFPQFLRQNKSVKTILLVVLK